MFIKDLGSCQHSFFLLMVKRRKTEALFGAIISQSFVSLYKRDLPAVSNLYAQLDLWETYWKWSKDLPDSLVKLLPLVDEVNFPTIHQALSILATLPFTTCSAERCVSGLRRVKPWQRNTMTEERLNSQCLIMMNRDVVVNADVVVNRFHTLNPRRVSLANVLCDVSEN